MAVAGFRPDDLDIVGEGQHPVRQLAELPTKVKRPRSCIAALPVEHSNGVSCWLTIWSSRGADVENGLLHVGLKRVVPESLKPRKIAISSRTPAAHHISP